MTEFKTPADVCKACPGFCCDMFQLPYSKKQLAEKLKKGDFKDSQMIPRILKSFRRVKRPSSAGSAKYWYKCLEHDSETGMCRIHDNRPSVCRVHVCGHAKKMQIPPNDPTVYLSEKCLKTFYIAMQVGERQTIELRGGFSTEAEAALACTGYQDYYVPMSEALIRDGAVCPQQNSVYKDGKWMPQLKETPDEKD